MNRGAKVFEGVAEAAIWLPILFLSSLLIHNGLLYYRFDMDYGILPEKQEAIEDPIWLTSLYIHVITSMGCLLIPVINFIGRHFKLPTKWHIILGKIYVWNNILLVAPTGIYMATYAKGGWLTEVGFIFQGVLLIYFSYLGYKHTQTSTTEHIKFMIRSYAIVLAALTFRVLHIIFIIIKIPYEDNYAISQWLSITLNMTIAEIIIGYMLVKKNTSVPLLKINI